MKIYKEKKEYLKIFPLKRFHYISFKSLIKGGFENNMVHKLVTFPILRERSLEDEGFIRMNRIRIKVARMRRVQQELNKSYGS